MSFAWTTGRYFWDFSKNGIADVTLLGAAGTSITQLDNGININQSTANDVKAKLKEEYAANYNYTLSMDCTFPSTGNLGICFRTTSFTNVSDSYAWYFGVTATGWILGYGSNSSYASWTTSASGTGSYAGRHIIKVVLSGNTINCYIDGTLVKSISSSTYSQWGYNCLRAERNTNDGRVHSLEILSTNIPDPTTKNINAFVKVVFDRDVHFPYSNMKDFASAFTAIFQQRDFYHTDLYQKTITAVDIVHAKDSQGADILNIIVVKFPLLNSFRKAESAITLHYDSSKCMIYGKYAKDKLANFDLTFTAIGIDHYQQPNSIESARVLCNVGNTILSIPLYTVPLTLKAEAAHVQCINSIAIVPTLTGTIKP